MMIINRMGNHYPQNGMNLDDRIDLMNRYRKKYEREIYDYFQDKGYFELPRDSRRFSPIKFHGDPITRSNKVIFYYISLIRGYTSRNWISSAKLSRQGILLLHDELVEKAVMNENGMFDTSDRITRNRQNLSVRSWYRYSMTPYINLDEVGYGDEGFVSFRDPYLIKNSIRIPDGTTLMSSDRFYYDENLDRIYRPKYDDVDDLMSIYDYLFSLVEVIVSAEGKYFRHCRTNRRKANYNRYLKELGESVICKLGSLMILNEMGMDLSKISDNLVRITSNDYSMLMKYLTHKEDYFYRWCNQAYEAYEVLYELSGHYSR